MKLTIKDNFLKLILTTSEVEEIKKEGVKSEEEERRGGGLNLWGQLVFDKDDFFFSLQAGRYCGSEDIRKRLKHNSLVPHVEFTPGKSAKRLNKQGSAPRFDLTVYADAKKIYEWAVSDKIRMTGYTENMYRDEFVVQIEKE
jgi:hypothetical protein